MKTGNKTTLAILVVIIFALVGSVVPRPSHGKCVTFECVSPGDYVSLRDFGLPFVSISQQSGERFSNNSEIDMLYPASQNRETKINAQQLIFNLAALALTGMSVIFIYQFIRKKAKTNAHIGD